MQKPEAIELGPDNDNLENNDIVQDLLAPASRSTSYRNDNNKSPLASSSSSPTSPSSSHRRSSASAQEHQQQHVNLTEIITTTTTTTNNYNSNNNKKQRQQDLTSSPLMSSGSAEITTGYQSMNDTSTGTNAGAAAASSSNSTSARPAPSFANRLVLAIVNPLSGERSAANGLVTSLLAVLGEERVLKLSPSVFRDSQPIARRISEGARRVAAANPDGTFDGSTPAKRMSLLVAGGDGTVSFIIGVIENLISDPDSGLNGVAPAIMVVPMGTGNDLSNAMGYGLGFTTNKCCCCCFCCPNDVEQLVRTGLSAPITPFDRWNATLYRVDNKTGVQLSEAARQLNTNVAALLQASLQRQRNANQEELSHNTAASGCYNSKAEWARSMEKRSTPTGAGGGGSPTSGNPGAPSASAACVSPVNGQGNNDDDGNNQQQQKQQQPQQQQQFNFVPLASFDFNNYFSFGLDAAIANDFDEKRRAYPSCHTYRTLNKLWYGYHGLAMAISAVPFNNERVSICCDKNEVALSSSQEGCRAFVISNIPSYSGGVDLWHVEKTGVHKQTVNGKTFATRDVTYAPNSVHDGMLEAVTIGGFFHLGFLQVKLSHGDKIAQGAAMTFSLGDFVGSNSLKGKSLTFQVDGEPAGVFAYDPGALVVDIKINSRVYFHRVQIS